MSAPECAPGTVVMAKRSDGEWRRALCGKSAYGPALTFADGTYRLAKVTAVRPLVVIDPEEREQVERLIDLYASDFEREVGYAPALNRPVFHAVLTSALREFAKPTQLKPVEPTDPAARVRDKDGDVWASWNGEWSCLTEGATGLTWDELVVKFGPLEVLQ